MLLNSSGDYTRGSDTLFHAIRMFIASTVKITVMTAITVLVVATAVAWHRIPDDERNITALWAYSWFLSDALKREETEIELDYHGDIHKYKARYFAHHPEVIAVRDGVTKNIVDSTMIGIFSGGLLALFLVTYSIRRGRILREERFIRGGEVVRDKALARILRRKKKASDIQLGVVPMVAGTETYMTMVSGAPGAGKTVLQSAMLDSSRKRGDAAIVYDCTGYYVQKFFRPGDVILSALDERTPSWDLWSELSHPADALQIAESLIPTPLNAKDPFWTVAAQHLFAAILLSMRGDPERSIGKLIRSLSDPSTDQIANVIKGLPISAAFSSKADAENRMAQSIRGTLLPSITALQFLRVGDGSAPFSLRQWVQQTDRKPNNKPWLFILSRPDYHAAMKPLLSLWIDTLAISLLSLEKNLQRRFWFFLDELPSLHKLSSISQLLAQGRQSGAACVLGLQSFSQLRSIYGADDAAAIADLCNTHAIFRSNNPETAQWASRLLGERDTEESKESFTYSASKARDGIHLAESRQTRPIVLATEISQLDPLNFFVKLAGNFPVTRTKITPIKRVSVAPAYADLDVSQTGWANYWHSESGSRAHENKSIPISFDDPSEENKHEPR